jgi:uncharacterized protein YfeS
MPNEYKQVGNVRVQLTDAEQATTDADRITQAAAKAEADAIEATRLSKRLKRSEINALSAKVGNDSSVAELRETVALLVTMMNDVLSFQNVDIDEDE